MVGGQVFAIDVNCNHQGEPLEEGTLEGYNLTCPRHYAVFDVGNGKVSDRTVWTKNQTYPVKIDDETEDISILLQECDLQGAKKRGAILRLDII